MTARTLTIAGWIVLAAAAAALELRARLWPRRFATLGAALGHALRIRFVRFVALAGWTWLGWHLFVR
jgi:uncharacterized protein DUF6186